MANQQKGSNEQSQRSHQPQQGADAQRNTQRDTQKPDMGQGMDRQPQDSSRDSGRTQHSQTQQGNRSDSNIGADQSYNKKERDL